MLNQTRYALLGVATVLVRQRGFNAVSYADLAVAIGIKKPSIHHHFPLKEDLGVEMVARYTDNFSLRLSAIVATSNVLRDRLEAYADLYREGLAHGEGCLCGVLSSELAALPDRVKVGVKRFFALNEIWLEDILMDDTKSGRDQSREIAASLASTVLSTFQGAVFVALALDRIETFDAAVIGLIDVIAPKA